MKWNRTLRYSPERQRTETAYLSPRAYAPGGQYIIYRSAFPSHHWNRRTGSWGTQLMWVVRKVSTHGETPVGTPQRLLSAAKRLAFDYDHTLRFERD